MNEDNDSRSTNGAWHSRPWWQLVGVMIAALALIWGIFVWFNPGGVVPPPEPSNSTSTSTPSMTQLKSPARSQSVTSEPTISTESPSNSSRNTLYLADIPSEDFIRDPYNDNRGIARIGNIEYPSSYYFQFHNCSNCEKFIEFNSPEGYTNFTGALGLTSESRHDDEIDGALYFSIYSDSGQELMSSRKVEYPNTIPFDIDITNVSRLQIKVGGGDNYEHACLCDARFIA